MYYIKKSGLPINRIDYFMFYFYGYQEFVILKHLKAKHILSEKVADPEIMYEYPEQRNGIDKNLPNILKKLL